jgi:hypothetical protein
MPPIALKIKGSKSFFPLSNLDSEEDLSKTWRVCTKIKDSLENGSRLENLSWRLWHYNDKCNNGTFQSLSKTTAMKLDHHQLKFRPLKNKKKRNNDSSNNTSQKQQTPTSLPMMMPQEQQQQQPTSPSILYPFNQQQHLANDSNNTDHHLDVGFDQTLARLQQHQRDGLQSSSSSPSSYLTKQPPLMIDTKQNTNQFMLNQFTSDQTNDSPMVELDSLFGVAFDHGGGFLQQAGNNAGAVDLMMDNSTWNLGSGSGNTSTSALATTPSFANNNNSSNHYFTPVTSPLESASYHLPIQTSSSTTHYQQQQQPRSYASSPTIATNYNMSLSMPSSPTSYLPHHHTHQRHHHHHSATSNEAMYVSSSSSMPPPTSTLGSKLFANYALKEDQHQLSHSSSTINLGGDDFTL